MRPKVFLLDLVDPERSLEDPALRALVAAGWTCSGSWPVVRDAGAGGPEKVQLMLLLWPPASALVPVPLPAPGRADVLRSRAELFGLIGVLGLLLAAAAAAVNIARWLP